MNYNNLITSNLGIGFKVANHYVWIQLRQLQSEHKQCLH